MGHTLTWTMLAVLLSAGLTEHVYGWTPGVGNESATSGFTVDRQSRNDVVSFWHAVYKESEGYENRINWTGLGGGPGSTSAVFKGDVQRRINYYRAMAGMDASMGMSSSSTVLITSETPTSARPASSTTKLTAAQHAAYMITINSAEYRPGGAVATGSANPHDPPSSWGWDSSIARNGAFYSNLASGVYGPGAIDSYMIEGDQAAAGGTNHEVAHRRLILYSRRAEFATGDVTMTPSGSSPYFAANALYSAGNLLAVSPSQFVAWPGAGFFPEPLSTKYWSLSYPGADFSAATVSMTHAAEGAIGLSVVSRVANFGDRTLIWEPNASQLISAADADQTYQITVANILVDGVPQNHNYTVTLINPDRLDQSLALLPEAGPGDGETRYYFDPVEHTEGYRLQIGKKIASLWQEGAEDSTSSLIIDGTSGEYVLRSGFAMESGLKGFHIGLTNSNFQHQYVELARQLIPSEGSSLEFMYRRRRMGGDTRAKVEISSDDGASWSEIWGLSGNSNYENAFNRVELSLQEYAGSIVRFRFSVYRSEDAGTSYWPADQTDWGTYNGMHFDSIGVTGNTQELVDVEEFDYAANAQWVVWGNTIASAGEDYTLRLRAKLGNRWMPFGPALDIDSEEVVSELSLSDESETFSAAGGAHSFDVASNEAWSWSVDVAWITSVENTPQSGNQVFSFQVAANNTDVERSGTIKFTCDGLSQIHTVYQAGSVVISRPDDLPLPPGSIPISVNSASAGKYGGFLSLSDGQTAGYFKSIKLASSGKFSAKMYWGRVSYSVKGVLDENGAYIQTVKGSDGSFATVNLQLTRTSAGGYKLEGTVSVGTQTAQVVVVKSGLTPSLTGTYTLLILGDTDGAAYGYGVMSVTSQGAAKITGILGDGSKWTAKCLVTADGEMPLYYAKTSSVVGLVRFRNVADVSDCDAQLEWRKPSASSAISSKLIGSRFVNSGGRLLSSISGSVPNVEMTTGSGDTQELWPFEWTSTNRLNYQGVEKVKLSLKTTNGQIKGKVPSGGENWKVGGVIFQKQNLAAGLMYASGKVARSLIIVPKN